MKNIKIIIRYPMFSLLLFLILSSCDSFVDVDLPSSQLTSPTVFEEPATANAAMSDIYSKLRDSGLMNGNGSGMNANLGVYTDELDYYGSVAGGTQFFYSNTLLPNNGTISEWWNVSYNQIYAANAVYYGVEHSTKLTQAVKDRLMGEALFVRALVHFNLTNLYGSIPYIATTDYTVNQTVGKMTTDAVYNRVISDLELAQTLLPTAYTGLRIRPTKLVATALLARVYLYNGDYAEAANSASALINETGTYSLDPDLDTTFLKESPSTIWQFIPQSEGRNTDEGAAFIFTAGPPSSFALRSELLNSFEAGDLRKSHWIKEVSNGSDSWYHAFKYKEQTTTGTTNEYSIVLRLSEQYLIRAEARARQGEVIGAKEDLNVIRNLAGLGNTNAVTQQELLDAVLQERRVELFTEGGHRFFDLRRAGQLDAALSPLKPGWNSTDALVPLPQSELLLNPNLLPQNSGY